MIRSAMGIALAALAALAFPAQAFDLQQVRRDQNALLWVDVDSINTKAEETYATYVVDLRQSIEAPNKEHYRSMSVRVKIRCKDKQISTQHTDGYTQWRATGFIVAKTRDTPEEMAWHPLEKDTSDEDVWKYVCEVHKGQAPKKTAPTPAKSAPPVKSASPDKSEAPPKK